MKKGYNNNDNVKGEKRMRRTSNTLLRVGMIVSTVFAALVLISAVTLIVLGVLPGVHEALVEYYNSGDVHTSISNAETFAIIFQSMLLAAGISTAIYGALCVVDAIIASMTLRNPTKNGCILCIVFGALSTGVTIVGGIFGLIAESKENSQTQIEE